MGVGHLIIEKCIYPLGVDKLSVIQVWIQYTVLDAVRQNSHTRRPGEKHAQEMWQPRRPNQ